MKSFFRKNAQASIRLNSLTRAISFLLIIMSASCKKYDLPKQNQDSASHAAPICYDCEYLKQASADSLDQMTLLGEQLKNPYTLPNMTEAYRNLYGQLPTSPFPVTHLYVRFSPRNFSQLDQLEEEDLPLYDFPLDQKTLFEGGFYVQPGRDVEDVPDYYTVVKADYRFPKGVSYEILERMYIPQDEPELEDEALRISGNLDDGVELSNPKSLYNDRPVIDQQSEPLARRNEPGENCNHYPSGRIVLQDELTGDKGYRGVRKVKVEIRRMFKIETVFTDDQGYFESKVYFRNKYRITVKFKNKYARISRMRPKALREQFFPIAINFGKWSNLDCSHQFRVDHPVVSGTIATSQWCASITQNAILEYREMAQKEGIGLPPEKLNIMLSSKKGSGNGNTYMLNKILKTEGAVGAAQSLITVVAVAWTPIAAGLFNLAVEAYKVRSPDIKYGYGGDPSFLTTDRYCELVYHELGHSAHYTVVGSGWWLKLGIAESKNPGVGSYGDCCTEYASCIALAEGWAYFVGHFFADKKWKEKSTSFPEQGNLREMQNYLMFSSIQNMSSHLNFLESYQPNRALDPNRWIPKGLMYDLYDPAEESIPISGLKDEVSGFTVRQIFSAMQKNVNGIEDYKTMLMEQNRNNQKEALKDLFQSYGY